VKQRPEEAGGAVQKLKSSKSQVKVSRSKILSSKRLGLRRIRPVEF